MAKASIHFQTATAHSQEHNKRDSKVTYLIIHNIETINLQENDTQEDVDLQENNKNIYKFFCDDKEFLEEAKQITKEKTGRKMQQKAVDNFVQEAVVNIKDDTTVSDIENLFKKFKQEFGGGFEVFDIAVHRDEGVFIETQYDVNDLTWDSKNLKWFLDGTDVTDEVIAYAPNRDIFYNENDRKWYFDKDFKEQANTDKLQMFLNQHAHIRFTKFDKEKGKNVRLSKSNMSKMQDITANILQMERGEKYSKNPRMTQWQRKELYEKTNKQKLEQKQINTKLLASQKQLKDAIKRQRDKLKKLKATRNDYAKLEQLNRDLKEQIKAKELSLDEMKQKTKEFETKLLQEQEHNQLLNSTNELLENQVKELKNTINTKNTKIQDLKEETKSLAQKFKDNEKRLINALESKKTLEASISMLEQEKSQIRQDMNGLEQNKSKLQTKLSEILECDNDELEVFTEVKRIKSENIWFRNSFKKFNDLLPEPKRKLTEIFEAIKNILANNLSDIRQSGIKALQNMKKNTKKHIKILLEEKKDE